MDRYEIDLEELEEKLGLKETYERNLIGKLHKSVFKQFIKPIKASTLAKAKRCVIEAYLLFLLENYLNIERELLLEPKEKVLLDRVLKYLLKSPMVALKRKLEDSHHGFYIALKPRTIHDLEFNEVLSFINQGRILTRNYNSFQVQGVIQSIHGNELVESIISIESVDERFKETELKAHLFKSKLYAWIIEPKVNIKSILLLILDVKRQKLFRIKAGYDGEKIEAELNSLLNALEKRNFNRVDRKSCPKCFLRMLCQTFREELIKMH